MARKEIMQSCLSERQAKMDDLQKQIEQINTAYEKLEFEEDMYYHLKDNFKELKHKSRNFKIK